MALEFKETLEITLPDFNRSLEFLESTKEEEKNGLIVEVAAIHVGATANFNYYGAEALEESINSWTEPYPKPVILNHDPYSESVGRIIGARMDVGEDGTPFVRLQAAITDPVAIQKLKDKRFLTGSVGGKADEAVCTICDTNWAAQENNICKHRKGKVYNGKVAFLKMNKIKFKEYSWVNIPADERSQVLSMQESSNEQLDAAECFILDMEHENVSRVSESGESTNVLSEMKRKEALPIYMGLKGSFLTAMALQEAENTTNLTKDIENSETHNTNTDSNKISEENSMPKTVEQTEERDLLDVVEGLAEEADAPSDQAASEEVADKDDAEASDGAADDNAEKPDSEGDDTDAAEGTSDEAPEGQEKPGDRDVDPETSDGAPPSREGEEDRDDPEVHGKNEAGGDPNHDDSPKDESTNEVPKTGGTPTPDKDSEEADSTSELVDEGEADEVDEPQESDEDTSELGKLREENARLRKAMHRMLAERVVDAKIAAGIPVEDRKEAIAEHAERSASSLADSLRDLALMPTRTPEAEEKVDTTVQSEVAVAEAENGAVFDDADGDEEVKEEETPSGEDFLVDVLMGRKTL